MDELLAKLEHMLGKSGVPKSLWPRILEREKYRLMRTQRSDDEWIRQINKLKKDDEIERKKQDSFYRWLLFLFILLDLNRKDCVSFLNESYRQMHDRLEKPDPVLGEGGFIERSFAAVALCKYSRDEVLQALESGVPAFERLTRFDRGEVTKTVKMSHAITALQQAEAEQVAVKNAPQLPAPAESQQSAYYNPEMWGDDLSKSVANPDF